MTRLALLPLALVACVDSGDEGMYVVENTAVTGTSCALTGNPEQPFTSHGIIQYQSPLPYLLTPLIQSRLTSVDNTDVVSKTIQLRRADIKLTLVSMTIGTTNTQHNSALSSFSSLFSGALPPGGFINVGFDLIPTFTMATLGDMAGASDFSAEVLADVTIRGVINDDEISSSSYLYPVTVCSNCVVNVVGACPMTGAPRVGNACNPFQDGVIDCCSETTGTLTCPGRTM